MTWALDEAKSYESDDELVEAYLRHMLISTSWGADGEIAAMTKLYKYEKL